MIIDSSAIISILRAEDDAPLFSQIISNSSEPRRMSAANYFETAIVIDGSRDPVISQRLDTFIERSNITIEPVTEAQAKLARQAYRDFGKGSGHPAGLNFGDCFAYALAKDTREKLLFKGNDFAQTDIVLAS